MVANDRNKMIDKDIKEFNNVELKLLNVDKKENLSFNNKDSYYGFGWSHNFDKQGIWSEGKLATLLFSVEQGSSSKILEIQCEPYLTNKNKNLVVDIYVNDKFNQNLKFTYPFNPKDQRIRILLNEQLNKDKEIIVDFNINNPVSPLDVFESPDSRKLGILLQSIKLI